jgi:L,D-transpeptidase-like protein/putative peptidoglycan binding protein
LKRRRWIIAGAAVGGLAFAAGAFVASAYFYERVQRDKIAKGVVVAGVPVGGLERDRARARLGSLLVPRLHQRIRVRYSSRTFDVDPKAMGVHVDVNGMVAVALSESRRGNFFHRFFRDVRNKRLDVRVPLHVTVSNEAVEQRVAAIAAAVHRKAVSARVFPSALAIRRVPSRNGAALMSGILTRVLERRLADPDSVRTFKLPVKVVQPKVTTAELPKKYPVFLTVCRGCFQLRLWKNLKVAKIYPIAVGRQGLETPAGLYTINDKQIDPSWHVPHDAWAGDLAGRVIPPGPDDPLKARWMGFWNGSGIHGTADTWSLGSAASHGCIRMSIPDVIELYDQVPFGTPIYVG